MSLKQMEAKKKQLINETKDTSDYFMSKMNKNLNNEDLFAVKAGP